MLKHLFTPMDCDRACRRRVYASWILMIGFVFLSGFTIELARKNGLQIDDRKSGVLFVGIMALLSSIVLISLCRSFSAYQAWRQSNPWLITRVLRKVAPMLFPRRPDSFRFCMGYTLFSSAVMLATGVILVVMTLK